jgi:hypothetical protein
MEMPVSKPILVLDFDGVLHSYTSGWRGADVIPDPPVPGAMKFIWEASDHFTIAVFSSRSHQPGGTAAMMIYLYREFTKVYFGTHVVEAEKKFADIQWPREKPAAMITIDDRAITFTGVWPEIETLKAFRPWNKR